MNVLKTIFWTTVFWLILLLIVFIYAKYTTSGESLANSIAKQLGVTPAAEMMVDTGAMAGSGSDMAMIKDTLMMIDANVSQLLEMQDTSTDMSVTSSGDMMIDAAGGTMLEGSEEAKAAVTPEMASQ